MTSKRNLIAITVVGVLVLLLIIAVGVMFQRYLISEKKIIELNSELENYKMTSLELEERVNKITNNFGSGGGNLVRVFQRPGDSGVVELNDFFSFDRYHFVYLSEYDLGGSFLWVTKNRGTHELKDLMLSIEATTVEGYMTIPYDINTTMLEMNGIAKVKFDIYIEGLGQIVPEDDFEIIRYKIEATDGGLKKSNQNDSLSISVFPNSVDSPGLYKIFGEKEVISGDLSLFEITIERSER